MTRPSLRPFLFSSLALAACSGSAGPSDGQPYATLQGTVSSSLTDLAGPSRAAVIWEAASGDQVRVTQDIAVGGTFPASFTLPLTALPPEAALQTADDGTPFSIGTVVVYEDDNGNGKLDLVSLDQPATDRILGTLPNEVLFYIQGTPPPPSAFDGVQLATGFNLVALPVYEPSPDASCEPGCMPVETHDFEIVPLTTALTIELTGSPALASLLCGTDQGQGGSGSVAPSLPPAGATVTCSADGTAYEYTLCPVPATPCSTETCQSGWGAIGKGPTTTSWPCPMN